MISWYKQLYADARHSVKMLDIEERYDLAFSRPFGLLLARWAARLGLNPTTVSIMSLVVGSVGGALFLWQGQFALALTGSLLIVLSGLLDSADGQLARMTNQSTDLGRIIDGIVDNAVFITAYVCSAVYLFDVIGMWQSYLAAALAGYAHSLKSSVYELHKSDYLYFMGRFDGFRLQTPDEIRKTFVRDTAFKKFVYGVFLDYSKKQQYLGFRPNHVREQFNEFVHLPASDPAVIRFQELYRQASMRMLYWWAWIGGTNTQRAGILISILLGHFEIYLYLNTLSLIPHFIAGRKQLREDRQILERLRAEGFLREGA